MIKLHNVTLLSLTTDKVEQGALALYHSMQEIEFAEVKLLSPYLPEYTPSGIKWEKVDKMQDINEWNHYMFYHLWKHVDTEFSIVVHPDGFIVHPDKWNDLFLEYDYIGAAWDISTAKAIAGGRHEPYRVGNSVSLRSRKLLKIPSDKCISWRKYNNDYNEDTQISVHNRKLFEEYGIKFAPVEVAVHFSQENVVPEMKGIKPFAFHKYHHPGHPNWNYPRLKAINILESTAISNLCDYSFGDHGSVIHRLKNSFMKVADRSNTDFLKLCDTFIKEGKTKMTLFIDNVRLYNREIITNFEVDKLLFNSLVKTNDLLKLCETIPQINFIIFTGHDDTPIDDLIHDKIPDNVIRINAVNAVSFGGKVVPFYYGVQRQLNPKDNRIEIIEKEIFNKKLPTNLLYVNHSVHTNVTARTGIFELFINKPWSFVDKAKLKYEQYIDRIKDHKFMICPVGNAVDCHRNYEVLYLKRVPVMLQDNYLKELFKNFPVLWVNNWQEVTKELLEKNLHLYEKAQKIDIYRLDVRAVFKQFCNDLCDGK